MRGTSAARPLIARRVVPSAPIVLYLVAVHVPALVLGGNRFGLLLPTAALILFLLIGRSSRIAPPPYASWLWLSVIALGVAQITLGLTPDSGEAARIIARYALYAAVFLIAADVSRQPFQAGVLVKATAAWIALICLYGLTAWSIGSNPLLAELEAYPAPLEATFINRNAFALYAGFGLFCSLAILVDIGRRGFAAHGWIWAVTAAICATSIVLTASRGGFGACVLGVAIFAVVSGRRRVVATTLIVSLVVAGAAGEIYLRETPIFDDPRFEVHGIVLAETVKTPLLGHGLGAFQDTFRAVPAVGWRWGDWDHAHQQYLETAYEIGWPAATALFSSILLASPRPRCGDPIAALAWAALAAAAAHSLIDFSLAIPSVAMTLALLMGVASGRQRRVS